MGKKKNAMTIGVAVALSVSICGGTSCAVSEGFETTHGRRAGDGIKMYCEEWPDARRKEFLRQITAIAAPHRFIVSCADDEPFPITD